jgi:hypothetical protein
MYDRKHRVDWWRWSVLTAHNTDSESLKLEPKEAVLVFADLVQRGLLVPVVASDGGDAFTINPGRDAEWKQVMHPCWSYFREHGLTLLGYVVSGLVGAGIGVGLDRFLAKGP